ncbi:MAG: SPOR domain-containing protein [Fibrobacter sp.]|jgi:septal ring-binding cell division protein DamX|nr:SPOR domain-containing protein [Fibrobacter sp.]
MLFVRVFFFCLALAASLSASSPTDIDSLFRGKEYKPVLNDSLRSKANLSASVKSSGKQNAAEDGIYTLQFEALADFDAAQARRAQLTSSTGYAIQMVFDTPFYKLRGGSFSSKQKAEDKVRELSVYNINAFVVKLK